MHFSKKSAAAFQRIAARAKRAERAEKLRQQNAEMEEERRQQEEAEAAYAAEKAREHADKLAAELGLPENEEILMILDLGYAAEGVTPLPNHASRKPLSETVSSFCKFFPSCIMFDY